MALLLGFPVLVAHTVPAYAQLAAPATDAPAPVTVEVTGSANDVRRNASVAKVVVGRADLVRFGDNNLADALQRIPGVSVDRSPGQEAVIRLRGLGSGYTQILLNGDPVPKGFSINSISPTQIERIEVLRTATADTSSQAIAGTLNIVLKTAGAKPQREFKLGAGAYGGRVSPMMAGDYGDRAGALSYGMGLSASVDRDRWPATSVTESSEGQAARTSIYRTVTDEQQRESKLALSPRATWSPGKNQSLSFNGLLQFRKVDYQAPDRRVTVSGDAPEFAGDALVTATDSRQAHASTQWKTRVGENGRLESKLTMSALHRTAHSQFDAVNAQQMPVLHRSIESELNDRSLGLSGKYALGLSADHSLDVGWDGAGGRRRENRDQKETSPVHFPTEDLSEDYDATVSRLALYAQDEWTVSSQLSVYLGVRHEVLTTKTSGNVLAAVSSRSSVLSPMTQVLWKIPDTSSDQLRVALARTFKAPTTRELIPRRWVVNQNAATAPNFQGNPNLLPELAWGLDVGYERYLPGDVFLGLNTYGRHISRVVLPRIYQSGATWIETPTNNGNADVYGIELELKGKLKKLIATSADVDLRAGLSRNWSRIHNVPGPDNRLDRQPWLTASFGANWRLPDSHLTLGGNFMYEAGGLTRLSTERSIDKSNKPLLDLYALATLNNTTSLRFLLTNLLAHDATQQTRYADDSISETLRTRTTTFRTYKVVLEMKL
ncbi:TonB-dependent receptor [Duganella sp. FT92W]|uniref:TonB-dependent receptor n=1 Tax=Pseudoduganella rivuli TaxID=2666085 RepID=A0A7X2IMC0_9BURK|nr:TonB-dependent receptor [Pseudoduganella rivuli]MRV72403.1 TonB-dependent receptor [Pseudoduganella rivuli]